MTADTTIIRQEFIDELRSRDYNYTEEAVDIILSQWLESKAGLIELFRKHPNWNEEHFMIHFDTDFPREINTHLTRERIGELFQYKEVSNDVYSFSRDYCTSEQYLREGADEHSINSAFPELKAKAGERTSRVVGRLCKILGVDKELWYNSIYASYCDAINPLYIKRHTCISLNPLDYLLMSNGNSWRSCHFIGDKRCDAGCYSSGTISYMLDKTSFIFYSVDEGFNSSNIELERKINRQVFAYSDMQLLQSRLYPQNCDSGAEHLYKQIREVIQKTISECEGTDNLWIKKSSLGNVCNGEGATNYPDWEYNSLCNVSVHNSVKDRVIQAMTVGSAPVCVKCGNRHKNEENIMCNICYGYTYVCESCGNGIDEDDVIWIDRHPYCENCVTWCSMCESYELNDYSTYVDSENIYVCSSCLDEYYTKCDDCGEYIKSKNINSVYKNGVECYVCDSCFESNYCYCDGCGDYFHSDDITFDADYDLCYCADCMKELGKEDAQ